MLIIRVAVCVLLVICLAGCGEDDPGSTVPPIPDDLIKPDGTGVYPTIQAAVIAAAKGDTIELADGVFTGEGNRDIDVMGKAITIRSKSGDFSACVVDCQADADSSHRGFIFANGEGSGTVIEGFGIVNGNVLALENEHRGGGAILCLGTASPTFRNLGFSNNVAGGGGALACFDESAPIVLDCSFENNDGQFNGGAILCYGNSTPFISNSDFLDNYAYDKGGAIRISSVSAIEIADCRFEGNVSRYGGAIAGGGFSVSNSLFEGNSSWANYGGAIDGSRFSVQECVFVGNSAPQQGGAISAWGGVDISDCVLAENKSDLYGGAVHFSGENTITGCTLIGNEAGKEGSGVYGDFDAAITITRSIIAFGVKQEAIFDNYTDSIIINCSNIFGNEGGDWTDSIAGQFGVQGNTSADPLFCQPSTEMPEFWNIRADSPCLDTDCGTMGAGVAGCNATNEAKSGN